MMRKYRYFMTLSILSSSILSACSPVAKLQQEIPFINTNVRSSFINSIFCSFNVMIRASNGSYSKIRVHAQNFVTAPISSYRYGSQIFISPYSLLSHAK